jgi:enoyl-CoA hydratase
MINLEKPVVSAIGWLAGPIFDQSIALEMLTFMGEDVREGVAAIREKRAPRFPSAAEPPR